MTPERRNEREGEDLRSLLGVLLACVLFAAGEQVCLDVDGECGPADFTDDPETIEAVCAHAGCEPKGSDA